MNKNTFSIAIIILAGALLAGACKKTDTPQPDEQELITTARLSLTSGGVTQTFTYRVENGFNSSTPGTVIIDTIRVAPNTVYDMSIDMLNEKASPVDNITEEIVEEQDEHLFLYVSTPAAGAGSLAFSNGSKDANGAPFNRTGTITSGAAGSGTLVLSLIHAPTDKNGATTDACGGETDVQDRK